MLKAEGTAYPLFLCAAQKNADADIDRAMGAAAATIADYKAGKKNPYDI